MQCPVCGNEMEKGRIRTRINGRAVNFLWAPVEYFEKHKCNPDLRSNNSIKKEGGVQVEIYLPPFGIDNEMPEAYYCRGCQKILTDFIVR